jgi:fructuronate reductase
MSTARPPVRLCFATCAQVRSGVALPRYDRKTLRTGIVHFGPGAFHRAHQAFFVDRLLKADRRWGICEVALRGTSVPEALSAQDGLYTIAELREPSSYRIIGAIREAIAARTYPKVVRARLEAPATQVVTMTVTENGYCLTRDGDLDTGRQEIAHDLAKPGAPASLIGWLVEGLGRRHRAGLAPFTMISCDNISGNGTRLRRAVLQFAHERDGELARWIESEARFPDTMVDSITPASDEALKARVALNLGVVDMAPVQREPFVQWVMDKAPGPDWASAGVTVTRDVAGYEQAKLRLLNGAHSALAYLGLLRKHQTTRDAMRDPVLARFVRELLTRDIAPGLTPPAGFDIQTYIGAVLDRIANPAIEHHLGQIAWDGSQKLPYRLFASIDAALKTRRPVASLAIPLAAWMRFVRIRALDGVELIDPLAARLASIGLASTGHGAHDVAPFLALDRIFSRTLASEPGFIAALIQAYDAIGDNGRLPRDAP